MCTAVKYVSGDFYFGRTLDNDSSYGEELVIVPRRFKFELKNGNKLCAHYAVIGVAYVRDGRPLFYDAVNEKCLAMAGLNFVGNAAYCAPCAGKDNIATFEFIPWILTQCSTVAEAERLLDRINLTDEQFDASLPNAQLHWIIADKENAVTVESETSGLHVYRNSVGVLANNPPFPQQLLNLNNYMHLSPRPPQNGFSDKIEFAPYSGGLGAFGLPGDLSSESRFVRAAFTALNSPECSDCNASVNQFFHILDAVEQPRGCNVLSDGKYQSTIYSSCFNATKGILYYCAYDNRSISALDMHRVNLDGTQMFRYPFIHGEKIFMQN